MIGPDLSTGNAYDYSKHHFLETKVNSFYAAGYWDISETVELTAGARYTREEKDGRITIPYVHFGLIPFGFGGFDPFPALRAGGGRGGGLGRGSYALRT